MTVTVNIDENREQIISLWQECFGDKREYIEFFLDNCPSVCLGIVTDSELISMLFLLDGHIADFKLKYIYAAATRAEHRGKGHMANLIEFAKAFCAEEYDGIFLVPAEESLYGYYKKFGFIEKFKRYEYDLDYDLMKPCLNYRELKDIDEIYKLRTQMLSKTACFRFSEAVEKYSYKEHSFCGGKIYKLNSSNANTLAFSFENDKNLYYKEYLSSNGVEMLKISHTNRFFTPENIYIRTPIVYNSKDFMGKATKCGMCFPLNDKFECFLSSIDFIYAGMYLD